MNQGWAVEYRMGTAPAATVNRSPNFGSYCIGEYETLTVPEPNNPWDQDLRVTEPTGYVPDEVTFSWGTVTGSASKDVSSDKRTVTWKMPVALSGDQENTIRLRLRNDDDTPFKDFYCRYVGTPPDGYFATFYNFDTEFSVTAKLPTGLTTNAPGALEPGMGGLYGKYYSAYHRMALGGRTIVNLHGDVFAAETNETIYKAAPVNGYEVPDVQPANGLGNFVAADGGKMLDNYSYVAEGKPDSRQLALQPYNPAEPIIPGQPHPRCILRNRQTITVCGAAVATWVYEWRVSGTRIEHLPDENDPEHYYEWTSVEFVKISGY